MDPDIRLEGGHICGGSRLGGNLIYSQYLTFISLLEGSKSTGKLDGAMVGFDPWICHCGHSVAFMREIKCGVYY